MAQEKLRILVIGAHPDDCEVKCGGTAAMWSARGHTVRFVRLDGSSSEIRIRVTKGRPMQWFMSAGGRVHRRPVIEEAEKR